MRQPPIAAAPWGDREKGRWKADSAGQSELISRHLESQGELSSCCVDGGTPPDGEEGTPWGLVIRARELVSAVTEIMGDSSPLSRIAPVEAW